MDEQLLLLALLGLPLLGSDELRVLLAVSGLVSGLCTVVIGLWAWVDHHWPPASREASALLEEVRLD